MILLYNKIFYFFIIALLIALLLAVVSFIAYPNKQKIDISKVIPYECGFLAFSDTRTKFDIKFYLISILFILFDLELIFLLPLSVSFYSINGFTMFSLLFFLLILTLGFIYELKQKTTLF